MDILKKTLSNCKNKIINKYKEDISIQSKGKYLLKIIFSLTLFISGCIKKNAYSKPKQTRILKKLNTFYFRISIVSVFLLVIVRYEPLDDLVLEIPNLLIFSLSFIWGYFLLSRNNEIFLAFLYDAFDKIDGKESNSDLIISDRLKLSFTSYLELIINFSILFFLFPMNYWKDCNMPNSILENLYFSGVTITTLGYGDYSPIHWFPQFLTVYEVFCGFILIIVCFTIYTNMPNSKEGQK